MKISTLIFSLSILSGAYTFGRETNIPVPGSSIALAYPVSGIRIDGDTADWPESFMKYPISNVFGNQLEGKNDASAYFQTGYNMSKQALYFVVVVSDDSHIADTSGNAAANTHDSYSLFLDWKNDVAGSGVVSYQFSEKWKNLLNPADSWDPEVKNASWDNVQTACKNYGATTVYEFRIMLGDNVFPGKAFGVDHTIVDKDAGDGKDTRSFITWGNRLEKDDSPGKLGYVILMKRKEHTGTINGRLAWKDERITGYPEKIRLISVNNAALQVQVPVDTTGKYTAALPAGSYDVVPVWDLRRIGNDSYKIDRKDSKITVKISADKTVSAPLLEFKTLTAPDLIPEKGIMFDFNDTKSAELDNFVKAYQDFYNIPGVSLALIKDGKVIYHKTYGVKNAYTREPVDDKTLFEAASISKTVFAFAVNSLAEKGIIDLDKPLYQYLPFEEIAYDNRYKLMTARHVLSHQTGLPNWAYNEPDGKLTLKFTPGTGYGYSGEGFEYLKRVVVKITGRDIESVLNEEVIKPLGLRNIYYSKNEYLASVVANGHYENFPNRAELPESPGMAWSMYSEALSFSDFVLALFNRRVLKPETYNEMFRIQSVVPLVDYEMNQGLEIYYGLGIELEKTPFGFVFDHSGNNGDFQCKFMMFRDLNMGFIIFTNSDSGGKLAYNDLMKFLITGNGKK